MKEHGEDPMSIYKKITKQTRCKNTRKKHDVEIHAIINHQEKMNHNKYENI